MAAEQFAKWLGEKFGMRISWEPVSPDPPDLRFIVELEGHKPEEWAVEVTGLFQYAQWGDGEGNIRTIQAPVENLCERLSEAVREPAITGYIISGSGPFDARLRRIENRAREYIQSGKTEREYLDFAEASSEFEHISEKYPGNDRLQASVKRMTEERCRFSIQAITRPVKISWMAGLDGSTLTPDGEGIIADVMKALEYTIGRTLDAKLPRLKNLTGYDRKLLLIWSGYLFADTERVAEILSNRNLTVDDIDTIILIDQSSEICCVADPAQLFHLPS